MIGGLANIAKYGGGRGHGLGPIQRGEGTITYLKFIASINTIPITSNTTTNYH